MNNLSKMKEVAQETREKFEKNEIDQSKLIELYQKYNPLDDINSFTKKSKSLFPNLNCGLTIVYLKNILNQGKIINGKYKDNNHTFLLLDDNVVIDITSDQYDGPKVYVGPLKEPWSI